jgi:hypothetical protein
MISLSVSGGGSGVSVLCQVMQFRGSIVHALGHSVLLISSMQII